MLEFGRALFESVPVFLPLGIWNMVAAYAIQWQIVCQSDVQWYHQLDEHEKISVDVGGQYPIAILVDSQNRLFVSNDINNRVQVRDIFGKHALLATVKVGYHMCLDEDDGLFVADHRDPGCLVQFDAEWKRCCAVRYPDLGVSEETIKLLLVGDDAIIVVEASGIRSHLRAAAGSSPVEHWCVRSRDKTEFTDAALADGGRWLFVTSADDYSSPTRGMRVCVFDTSNGALLHTWPLHQRTGPHIAAVPGGGFVVCQDSERSGEFHEMMEHTVQIFDECGTMQQTFALHSSTCSVLLAANAQGLIVAVDVDSRQCTAIDVCWKH